MVVLKINQCIYTRMRKTPALLFVLFFALLFETKAQCTYTQSGLLSTSLNFSAIIDCDNGDVVMNEMNSNPGGDGKVIFDQDVTLNSLTINFASGNKPIEFIIPAGVTVTITNGMTFSGQADKDKFLTIEGDLDVGGTLDFGGVEFEIDGSGSISAGAITGADDTTCSTASGGTGTCPTITAGTCDDGGAGSGFCSEPSVTLPIELLFFKGSVSANTVDLTWATAMEENFDYFSVQRSRNGNDFEEITQIQGAGFSRAILNYSYSDNNVPSGRVYYRLNAIDFDRSFEYSNIIAVNTSGKAAAELTLYPNPSKGESLVIRSESIQDEGTVYIYDLSGNLVNQSAYQPGVATQFESKLKPGVYMVTVATATAQSKAKLIVQ